MLSFSFLAPSRPTQGWFKAGASSSYPDIDPEVDSADLSQPRQWSACPGSQGATTTTTSVPGCKVFSVSRQDGTSGKEVAVQSGALELDDEEEVEDLKDQVLIFRYRGKLKALDHKCPHASFPLSKGTPFDIEDFGVVLSAGLTCPKHGWSFDLHTGQSDRSAYRLAVWEIQEKDGEVWVRRKQRIG